MRSMLDQASLESCASACVNLLDSLLRCPCELHHELRIDRAAATATCTFEHCRLGGRVFPIIDGQPVLVDFADSVLDEATTIARGAPSLVTRSSGWRHALSRVVFGDKPTARRNAARFLNMVKVTAHNPVVLVVGGATIGDGAEALYREPGISLIAFDVYRSGRTQFVADAHSITVAEGTIDGVWVQAVLEHVLSPERVAAEIYRVLKPGGLVYAETPFMQQVHEGPYDFTRFTESGHRWLFRRFERIDSGVERGPFTVLIWSIRYALAGLLRSRTAATAICTALFWLRYLDHLVPRPYAVDGASEVFFLGRKSQAALHPKEVITGYLGVGSLPHSEAFADGGRDFAGTYDPSRRQEGASRNVGPNPRTR
jgi:SAM-dependent methyltransferase